MGKKNQRQKGKTINLFDFNEDANKIEDFSWAIDENNLKPVTEAPKEPHKKKERYITSFPDFRNEPEAQNEFTETTKDELVQKTQKEKKQPFEDFCGIEHLEQPKFEFREQAKSTKEKNVIDRETFGGQKQKKFEFSRQDFVTPDRNTFGSVSQEPKVAPKYKSLAGAIDRNSFGVLCKDTKIEVDTKNVSRALFGVSKLKTK